MKMEMEIEVPISEGVKLVIEKKVLIDLVLNKKDGFTIVEKLGELKKKHQSFRNKPRKKVQRKRWTEEEKIQVKTMFQSGMTRKRIAQLLGRTKNSVNNFIYLNKLDQ